MINVLYLQIIIIICIITKNSLNTDVYLCFPYTSMQLKSGNELSQKNWNKSTPEESEAKLRNVNIPIYFPVMYKIIFMHLCTKQKLPLNTCVGVVK